MAIRIDGRPMLPPQPLERTLAALPGLADGEQLVLLVNHRPEPLLFLLDDMGYAWNIEVQADGTQEVCITRLPGGQGPP